MKKSTTIPQYDANHYAVVDLGSNSFHLLIIQLQENKLIPINKVKRKVRLAAGLNQQLELSPEAMKDGLDCLTLFAKHLASIPLTNIRIVATATLRLAKNRDEFLNLANSILPLNIDLLTGTKEAETIYKGVSYTSKSCIQQRQLVIDIGGASLEMIVGDNNTMIKAISLNIGCVSLREKCFTNGILSETNFIRAIEEASKVIQPVSTDFKKLGWQSTIGKSGTIQALAEILAFRQQEIIITKTFLEEIKQALIQSKYIENITFEGLRHDRTPVLASGLSILIALFDCLKIKELTLSSGALREGLLFEMLPNATY